MKHHKWVHHIETMCREQQRSLLLFWFFYYFPLSKTCLEYICETSQMYASYQDDILWTLWLFWFMNYLRLSKICVWTITPKPYGILSWKFANGFIFKRWCVPKKKTTVAVLVKCMSRTRKTALTILYLVTSHHQKSVLTPKPYWIHSWNLQMSISWNFCCG